MSEEGGGKNFVRDRAALAGPAGLLDPVAVEPVIVVVIAALGPGQVRIVPVDILDPAPGGLEMPGQEPGVGIVLISAPGDDYTGVGPGGRARGALVRVARVRRVIRKAAVVRLVVADVLGELGKEGGQVHVEDRGLGEGLDVAHPAEALVALGAVVGRAHEVGALRPEEVAHELIEGGIRALELPCLGGSGVKNPADERRPGRRFGQAAQLDIPKAVVGEVWFEDKLPVHAREVTVHLQRAAQVRRVEGAIVVEHLGMAEGDRFAGGP